MIAVETLITSAVHPTNSSVVATVLGETPLRTTTLSARYLQASAHNNTNAAPAPHVSPLPVKVKMVLKNTSTPSLLRRYGCSMKIRFSNDMINRFIGMNANQHINSH